MNRKSTLTFFLSLLLCQYFTITLALAQQTRTEEIDLASALVAAKTQQERNQLLESKKHLVTPQLVKALIEKGNEFRIQGKYPESRDAFGQAKNVASSLNDKSGVAEALNGIGLTHFLQSEYVRALENFKESLNLSESIGNQTGIAKSLNLIGRVHYMQDDLETALNYYQKSLSISEALKEQAGIAESLNSIGLVHYVRGEHHNALEYLKRSLAIREKLNDDETIASSLNHIGLVYSYMYDYESAARYYKKSLSLREKLGDRAGIAFLLYSLGITEFHQANYDIALDYYHKSLKLNEELQNKMRQSLNLTSIGQLHQTLGNNSLALDAFQKALQLGEQVGDKSGSAHTLIMIGVLHYSQGNYKVALEYHKKGLQLADALGDKIVSSEALRAIGADYRMQGDNKQALEYYQKSLVMKEALQDQFSVCLLLNDIAAIQTRMGNLELAMKTLERSLAISQKDNIKEASIDALSSISKIHHEQGNYNNALDYASRAVNLARQIGTRVLLWESLTNLSKAYYATNQTDKAIHSLEEAIHTIETLRIDAVGGEREQQQFFEDKIAPYNLIVDFLAQKQGKELEALAYAERAKARALLDVLQGGRVTIAGALTRAELDQERTLNGKLISLNQQVQQVKLDNKANESQLRELTDRVEKARLNMEEFRAKIYAAHPELKVHRGEAEVVKPEQLNELLSDSMDVFLEYVVTEEKTFVFVITRTENQSPVNTNVFTINVKQKDLSSRINNFRNQMAERKPDFRTEAAALYNLLIGPATANLKTKRNLVIVPDDVLWELPFQALLSSQDRYLLEDYSLSYVPSLSVFNEMKKLKKKKRETSQISLFALGNPTLGTKTREQVKEIYRDAKLDPLPEAEKEVLELAKLYGDQQSAVYVGANAREERLKNEAAQFNFLHLATHGLLNDATPMYSQILLAQSKSEEEDGLLEAWEILNLKLNADLVVLSACDTALGKIGKGEGMIGLTWALFVAGVPTTVVSQWTVDSASTTELMIQFHKKLKSILSESTSKTPIPDALRAAALNLLQTDEYRHPFYWAPFVVIGAGF